MKNKKIYLVIGLIILCGLTVVLFKDNLIKIDYEFEAYITNNLREDFLTTLMNFFSFLASGQFLIIISVLLLVILKNKVSMYLIYNLVVGFTLNVFLKFVVARTRPTFAIVAEQGYSFPSGHAMLSTIFYGLIIYFVYTSKFNKIYKIFSIIILSIVILLISFSRLYLGVHYLSDVYSGILIGLLFICIFIIVKNKLTKN